MSQLSSQFDGAAYSGPDAVTVTDAADQVVLGPIDLQAYDRFGFYVHNIGVTNALTVVQAEHAPQEGGPWIAIGADVAVAAEAAGYMGFDQKAVKYVRLTAICAATKTTTARFWLCAGGAT
jgi:hypothetical protein